MYKKYAVVILVLIALTSCTQDRSIEFSSQSLTEKELSYCKDKDCPEVTINYVEVFGNESIAGKINNKIKSFIYQSLLLGEDTTPTAKTIEEAATGFIEGYYADKEQFPDMAGEYFAEISVNEIYNTENHICFELRQYLYTGGAHGYGTTTFLNINPRTGEELSANEIFKNKNEFVDFAEEKFRAQQEIDKNESINATGFTFENDKFSLPESFGFIQDSLIFVYNQYEIASYADGPIELKIALKEAKPFLKID